MAKKSKALFSRKYNSYGIIKFMNGHDNDANKNAQDSSAGAKGIFSTPELTVNAENITQQNNEETKSRVASIFANTDAGKQAQRLNDAMDAQTVSVTEDLVIRNEPKKKSKLPIILLILVLVVAGVGGLMWVLMNSGADNMNPRQTPSNAFANYIELLEKGPELPASDEENADSQTGKWSIFKLSQSGLQTSEQQKYTAELTERYKTFLEAINASTGVPDSLKEQAALYEKLLNLVIQYNAIGLLENEIVDKYIKDGAESSYQYASTIVDTVFSNNHSLQKIAELLNNYLVDEYKMVEYYDYSDCISHNEINYFCVAELELTNASYAEVATRQQDTRKMLNAYVTVLEAAFDDSTDNLADTVKEAL